MSLATLPDLQARLGETPIDDETRAAALLADASAAVTRLARNVIARGERTTTTVWPGRNGTFPLTGHNIADVSATIDGQPVDIQQVSATRWYVGRAFVATAVTYTAGYDPVPADIIGVICNAVIRCLGIKPTDVGYQQQSAGPFSVTIGSAAAAGPFGYLAGEVAIVKSYNKTVRGPIRSALSAI